MIEVLSLEDLSGRHGQIWVWGDVPCVIDVVDTDLGLMVQIGGIVDVVLTSLFLADEFHVEGDVVAQLLTPCIPLRDLLFRQVLCQLDLFLIIR